MKREFFALIVVIAILVAFPASLLAYQAWRTNVPGVRVVDLVGNSPNNGGWRPDTIRVNVGERVRVRIAAPDVVHGFAIPALGINVDEILPGHVEEVEFTATRAGRFPFACTRWCSADHWRMRGVIQVIDPAQPDPPVAVFAPPLFQQMKIDIDALHPARHLPSGRPSAARGASLSLTISEDLRTRAPADVFATLRADVGLKPYGDQALWDAIAFAYQHSVGEQAIARGEKLFARDCAACHGETGKGNGTAGLNLPGLTAMFPAEPGAVQSPTRTPAEHPEMGPEHAAEVRKGPADFTDASQMLGASDVLLQGKILRGGMGTGMPEWGSLYTEQEMWDVIAFIRSFTFDYGLEK
jgi:mono/diheme cytochrome c family protein